LGELFQAGVTRLSLGAQSFQAEELDWLGRRHSVACIRQAVAQARQVGFSNIGIDLISGLPHATLDSWQNSLLCAVDLGPQHISAYGLSIEPETALYRQVQRKQVTPLDEDTDRAMYELTIDFLEGHQYGQYEISNFAQPGFACQHNTGYWMNQPFLGLGPAAASYGQGQRRSNVSDVREYVRLMNQTGNATQERHVLTASDRLCETAVLNLRLRQGIDLERFQQITGQDALQVFAPVVASQRMLGLLELQAGHLRLTRDALPIADSVLSEFSALEESLAAQVATHIR
jgi:oxygen-independent coproporphyrinogen-3 oxidase